VTSQPRIPLARRQHGSSARDQAYVALRDAIVAAELAPGRQLSENELAGWLGVSRTPVREALIRLRDDRLVEIVPQLGTFVSRISVAAVQDAQFIREALECAAIRRAAERAGDGDVATLEAIIARQRTAEAGGDLDSFYEQDERLHETFFTLSGHGLAWSVSQRAKGHLNRVRHLSLPEPGYIGEMITEHELVIEAVGRADADAAEERLRHHLRMVLSTLPALQAAHPGFFAQD